MYEERRESFSVRDLILQVLFIVLFVFILILIFPTKGYMRKYVDNKDNGTNSTVVQSNFDIDQLAVLYNQIFANNIKTMKEAAIGYYTTDRLPAKVGATDKMTLQQMYDKHLVLKLTDKNGKACDATKSYVSVTKYENEYQMKVNLSCGSDEDYIIVYLGCYDYCDATGVCEKQTTPKPSTPKPSNTNTNTNTNKKYKCEYKKVTGGTWGAYGAWSKWTTTKITKNDETQVETKTEKVLTGYTTKKVQTGTKTETYISSYTTSKYVSGYTTEKYISGYTTEKYQSGTTTQKVQVGTKKVQTGTTTKTTTKKVAAGTTTTYVSSGSGKTIPSDTSEYKYVKTGSTQTPTCTGCVSTTVYTWDVYKITTVYKTEQVTETVPVYSVEPVYETKTVPVYSTRQVPVYSTRKVPVYSTKKTPVYSTRTVPVYGEVKEPVYKSVTYYRSRTRKYIKGTTSIKWSTCTPVDTSLTKQGYYKTGKQELVK